MSSTASTLRLAVCQAPHELIAGTSQWNEFLSAVHDVAPEILLLNEMPFGRWLASTSTVDPAALETSRRQHDDAIAQLGDFNVPVVLGSRPAMYNGVTVNEAFVWTPDAGYRAVHTKQYFPQEEGYFEASWYQRGETHFRVAAAGPLMTGFLICTEIMFNEWARHYGRKGAHLIAVPRATPVPSTRRWRAALQMAAIVSGSYAASSNRSGTTSGGQSFGAHGWIVDPYGDVVAETSSTSPIAVANVDVTAVVAAQTQYPCYVQELSATRQ